MLVNIPTRLNVYKDLRGFYEQRVTANGHSPSIQRFTGLGIKGGRHGSNLLGAVHAQIRAFRKYWRSIPLVFSLVPRCQGL